MRACREGISNSRQHGTRAILKPRKTSAPPCRVGRHRKDPITLGCVTNNKHARARDQQSEHTREGGGPKSKGISEHEHSAPMKTPRQRVHKGGIV